MVFPGTLIKQLSCFGRVYGLAGGRRGRASVAGGTLLRGQIGPTKADRGRRSHFSSRKWHRTAVWYGTAARWTTEGSPDATCARQNPRSRVSNRRSPTPPGRRNRTKLPFCAIFPGKDGCGVGAGAGSREPGAGSPGYSNFPAAISSWWMMSICCGHMASQAPQPMHDDARPASVRQP